VLGDRERQDRILAALARLEAMGALHPVPPEVRAARRASPLDVVLLPVALAHVADPQVAVRSIEADPPRVAEPRQPDLPEPCGRATRTRAVGGGSETGAPARAV